MKEIQNWILDNFEFTKDSKESEETSIENLKSSIEKKILNQYQFSSVISISIFKFIFLDFSYHL